MRTHEERCTGWRAELCHPKEDRLLENRPKVFLLMSAGWALLAMASSLLGLYALGAPLVHHRSGMLRTAWLTLGASSMLIFEIGVIPLVGASSAARTRLHRRTLSRR